MVLSLPQQSVGEEGSGEWNEDEEEEEEEEEHRRRSTATRTTSSARAPEATTADVGNGPMLGGNFGSGGNGRGRSDRRDGSDGNGGSPALPSGFGPGSSDAAKKLSTRPLSGCTGRLLLFVIGSTREYAWCCTDWEGSGEGSEMGRARGRERGRERGQPA